jgi:hypothetical protein
MVMPKLLTLLLKVGQRNILTCVPICTGTCGLRVTLLLLASYTAFAVRSCPGATNHNS